MTDFISTLASKAGIDPGNAQSGMGALLSTLQKYVPSDTFSKVTSSIPDSGSMMNAFQSSSGSAMPSLGGALSGLAGSLMGGGSGLSDIAGTLMSHLSQAGLSMEMIKRFLPAAANLLREHVPGDVLQQIEKHIPGITQMMGNVAGGGSTGGLQGVF